jgi:hypothetical protein
MENKKINSSHMDSERNKAMFLSEINSGLNGLEFQRDRIFKPQSNGNIRISPVHDADFYVVLLRRLYRRVEETAGYDSRVANLKGKYKNLLEKIKIRDHFEHGVDLEKLPSTDATQLPQLKFSVAAAIANIKIVTSVFINKDSAYIVSGNFKWDLYQDHETFIGLIRETTALYPFMNQNKYPVNDAKI